MLKKKFYKLSSNYWLIAVLAITLVVYFGVANFSYVNWDDDENIRDNIRFTEWSSKNLAHHFKYEHYKSLAIYSYMLEYQVFGGSPKSYHIINLFLHLINICLVFVFIRKLLPEQKYIPLIVSVLFAVHPAFVEPVAWITGRKDLLFVLFSLLSFILYIKHIQIKNINKLKSIFLLLGVVLATYLASMAKIQAVVLPFVLLLIYWKFENKITIENIIKTFILLLIVFNKLVIAGLLFVIFLIIKYRISLLKFLTKNIKRKLILIASMVLLMVLCKITYQIINKHVDIRWTYKIYLELIGSFYFWLIILFPIVLIIIFGDKLLAFKVKPKIKTSLLWISGLSIVGSLIIYLISSNYFTYFWNLGVNDENYFSLFERFLLLASSLIFYIKRFLLFASQNPMIPYPSRLADGSLPTELWYSIVAIIIILTISIFVLFKYFRKNKFVWFGVLFFLINIGLVLHIIPIEGRVLVADRYTYLAYIGLFILIGLIAEYFIAKKRGNIVFGVLGLFILVMAFTTYRDKHTWKDSFSLWNKALAVDSENHYAMFSLALAYFEEGSNPEMAEQYLNKAIILKEDFMYFNNRGRVRYAMGNYRNALSDFDKAIELDSTSFASYNNRGATRQQFVDFKGALLDYEKAIEIRPDYIDAINNKEKVLHLMHYDSIVLGLNKVLYFDETELSNFVLNTSEKLIFTEQKHRAIDYLERGINFLPNIPELYEKLAVIYHLDDEFELAKTIYNQGLKTSPNNANLLLGRGLVYLQTGDTVKACIEFQLSANQGDVDAMNLLEEFCK